LRTGLEYHQRVWYIYNTVIVLPKEFSTNFSKSYACNIFWIQWLSEMQCLLKTDILVNVVFLW
jgi:hypothetical protein